MLSKKLILISMGLLLCSASLIHASDYRKMGRQNHRMLSKRQKFLDMTNLKARKETDTFRFYPQLNLNTPSGKVLYTLLITASFIEIAQAFDHKPLSTQSQSDCLVTPDKGHHISQTVDSIVGNAQLTSATTSGLANIFCPPLTEERKTCVTMFDNEVTFTGSEEQVDDIIQKLENFSSLRQKVVPTSPAAAKTNAHPDSQFNNWHEVETSLGVDHEALANMAFSEDTENQLIAINYKGSESGGRSFNQRTADAYIDTLKEESMFFKFLADENKNLITYTDEHMIINYSFFDAYFRHLNLEKIQKIEGEFLITMPLDTVLKRLIAAVSGPVSLEKSLLPGEFHVRTINVGDELSLDERQSTPPIVEIIIDTSGSMNGEPINTVNKNLPKLLQEFTKKLGENDFLKVNIYSLSDDFYLSQSFDINRDSNPKWLDMSSNGLTDLTPVGRKLKIEEGQNPYKVVVAFTDGEHTSSIHPLDKAYYDSLRELQKSGSFAQPFLCKVGSGSEDFFKDIAKIFSGSYSKEDTTEECWKRVSAAIPDLLKSKAPLILTISGNNEVIWLGKSQDAIQTTTQTVRDQDEIVLGNFKATVKAPIPDEDRERRIAALRAELEALEY